jgi:hypothetical protein
MSGGQADMSAVVASGVWEQIRTDGSDKAWAVLELAADSKTKLEVTASGRCGLDRVRKELREDAVRGEQRPGHAGRGNGARSVGHAAACGWYRS